LRKILFWIHLGFGLCIALFMTAIAASGLVLSTEPAVMGWAEQPWARVAVPHPATRFSMDALASQALAQTGAEAVSGFTLQSDPAASVRLQLGRDKAVFMDPYTGKVLGEGPAGWRSFYQSAQDLHRWFLITGKYRDASHQVKCAVNAAFFLMILSGLTLWLPKTWNKINVRKIAVPNFSAKAKARDFNWHNVAGLWASPFILIVSMTGLIMSYAWASDLLFTMTGNVPPPRPQPAAAAPPQEAGHEGHHRHERGAAGLGKHHGHAAGPSASLDAYVKAAEIQAPGWISLNYRPGRPGQDTVTLIVQTEDVPLPRGRGTLTLKAATAAVDSWEPFASQNTGKRLRAWARWAHTGQAFGPLGEVLAGLACLAVLLLAYTGLAMSWRRFFGPQNA
jgi:uncharacterized iron-regulated membrane protein